MMSNQVVGHGSYELVIFVCGDDPRHHPLPKAGEVSIGRDRWNSDIVIADSSVSRFHAKLTIGEKVLLTDLGSGNGTFVRPRAGQARVDETELVQPMRGKSFVVTSGDRIQFGTVVAMLRATHSESAGDVRERVVVDPAMISLYGEVSEIAASSSRACVLLLGETGVGKEVLARAIHDSSKRAKKPFVAINCATLTKDLFGSELFGHVKGAFTGAIASRQGYLEYANGGTIVLDEVGELPLDLQARLLRVVEERQVIRVGDNPPRPIDVRIIASTNQDLGQCVAERTFREDLYYRLRGFELLVPPLRERKSEILPLARMFLEEECNANGRLHVPTLSEESEAFLLAYPFPGNVRELRFAMASVALHCHGDVVRMGNLPPSIIGTRRPVHAHEVDTPTPRRSFDDLDEKMRMLEALHRFAGNQRKAAEWLGMSNRTFVYKLDKYGIARPRKKTLVPGVEPSERP